MNPRMKEKGMPTQSDNDFQIRNPWIPLTPGKPILPGSDGISIDRNRNQLGRKNWSDFFELLDKNSKQTPNCNGAGNNFNLNNSLNHSNSSQGIAHHQMGNAILQTGPLNQNSSSNGMGDHVGNGIMQIRNNYNLNEPLNKNGSFGMGDYQMGNGILQSGQTNQISNSNATVNHIGNVIMQIGNNYNLNEPLNKNGSYRMGDYQMGNEMLQSANNFNLKRPMNQFSSSSATKNHTGGVIIQGGDNSNFTRPLYQGSGSNSMSSNQMGNRISQGGNNFIFTGCVNQITSSNGTGDQIGNGIMRGGNNSTFSGSINQISSSNSMVGRRMGNINLGHYENSQTQANRNNIQSFSASNMSPIMVPKTDSIISSSLVNLNMRPLSSPRGRNSPNAPLIMNAYSEVDSSWTEGNFTSLLLGDEIPDPGQNNIWLNSNNSHQMINDGLHIPVPCDNNINSPPRRTTNTFPFAPPTPDHTNILEKHRQAEMLKFLVDDGSFQENNKMEILLSSIGNEAIENHCSELLQTIVNPSSNVISTPQAENKIINERGDQDVIDLNETPKQKVPKRRKHRPKVVREGKPKRTPKPKTPNNGKSEETPSRKRKYVRKNKEPEVENATPQEKEPKNKVELPTFESREESCRKRLNFDFEKAEKGESQCTGRGQVAYYQGNPLVLDLNLNYTENQMPIESLAGKESHDPAATSEIISYNTLDAIAKKINMRNNKNQENQNLQGEFNKNTSRPNVIIERSKVVRWKSTHQMVERDVGNFKGFMSQEPLRPKNQETITLGTSNDETCKKQKTENDFPEILCGPEKEHGINGTTNEITTNAESFKKKKLTALNQQMVLKRRRERQPRRSTKIQSTDELQSVNISKNSEASSYQLGNENFEANMQNNWIETTSNSCRVISFCSDKVPLQEVKDTSHPFQQPPVKTRGRPKAFKYSKKTVDEITSQLQSLTISGEKNGNNGKDKYALVPYEGGGTMVSYEAKKRKPRPKVDLDPETGRIWKLLMGKEGTEADDAENKDKEKWWEEERRVFHGRAESFIARMHLVQGDRRFSPWKGSVIDSIVGVFLTQNVSDQLSSSAFMALAAQFPLCSTTPDQTSDQSGTSIITEEPEIQGVATEFNIITKKNTSSPQNSSDSSVHHINGEIQSSSGSSSEAEESNNGGKSTKNNDLSSFQNYNKQSKELDYTKQKQGSDQFDNLISFSPLNHPINSNIASMQNSIMPPGYFQMLMASQVARSEGHCFEISREECKYSFLSKAPEMAKDTMSTSLFQQNNFQNTQMPNIDPFAFLTKHRTVQNSSLQQVPQIGKDPFSLNNRQVERPQIYESEQKGFSNPSRPSEPVITSKTNFENQVSNISNHLGQPSDIQERNTATNKQVVLGEKPTDGNGKGQAYFSGETNDKISAKKLNTSQNHEKEKRDSFDWDSLRRMVQSNGGGKEKSVDASDSMDYEAMRCADVNKISNSIRMRGMNHMLAERIKDFLNRVVTDHGRLDLEWLRDVPADKSKDYLLSIRGLGLKSVECVRLLTLHHLAFPVDTNVGRIAVRLGWVPLQPLPESLQLHLLEMYPVLETVQKYLWPRLCKLDQKTLYELHYQLITFGKVFCTKSKPNCNACPMRGECRHFASAFASARLALPAPEEKGIVSSTIPITTDRSADTGIKPLLLQPSSTNIERELMVSRCEPIIEEPATPEPDFTEITETDIEDAFYEEDPDEIPTIRLNVEQLEINLRNFMEEHTDLNEGDMSKALVALTPEVASIPLPKLKYVLRLRTERQVYVLPDTHPLVKGLDKREPDDPSPYLLALLAPGEEASSGQPSVKKNESKGSEQMCNEKECCSVDGEANMLTVRGTLLIPCRTAMRGSFPLNGTYFQVNEVFADHESSINPIDVPRKWLWHLEMRTVFFGTSATSIFRGMTTKEIQNSFWRGFVCVRGFDQKTRAPRPLNRNLHFAQGKTVKTSNAAS